MTVGRVTPPDGREPLEALARWRPRLEDPDFRIGAWVKSWTDDQGLTHVGWFDYSPDAREFLGDVGRHGWVQVFDWQTWLQTPEGERIAHQPGGIEEATPDDLVRILTAIIRSDRFTEGSIAGAFESGLLTRVIRRAEALAAPARPQDGDGPA